MREYSIELLWQRAAQACLALAASHSDLLLKQCRIYMEYVFLCKNDIKYETELKLFETAPEQALIFANYFPLFHLWFVSIIEITKVY